MYTEEELYFIKTIQQNLDERSIPYLVVATKTDLVKSHSLSQMSPRQLIEMKKHEIASALGMRSFDILTIGMSGGSDEGIEDYEMVNTELYRDCLILLRQTVLNCSRVRSNEMLN